MSYLGKDVLISYLSEQEKPSYRGFLVSHRDIIIASPISDKWNGLDVTWSRRFLGKAKELLEPNIFVALKEKVKSERSGDGLRTYWNGVIKKHERNSVKRKSAVVEEKENIQPQTKKKHKPTSILLEGISLPLIVCNTLPNLTYLELRNKSNSSTESTEQRFPDKITNWVGFEQKVLAWQPEVNKKYSKSTFSQRRTVTCEKDIWTASDVNIYETLTPLNRSILFLDGRALKDTVGQPDFVIVNGNMILLVVWECKTKWVLKVPPNEDIFTLYNKEKRTREGPFVYSNNASIYDPINQTYGYMCANSLRYGVLSTYDQTWFLKRGVEKIEGKDHGWLHVSGVITNISTDPTLLKSVAYVIDLASKDRHAPFLEKPIMVANNTDEESFSDTSSEEQKGDKEFKYKRNLLPKRSNIVTRSQSRQALGSLNTNVNLHRKGPNVVTRSQSHQALISLKNKKNRVM